MSETQLDLFGEVEARESEAERRRTEREAARRAYDRPATCPCCGMTEANGWLLRNNHGVDPETGGIGGFPRRKHPIYGAQCIAQILVTNRLFAAARENRADVLARDTIRGRELGLDVEAIIAAAGASA